MTYLSVIAAATALFAASPQVDAVAGQPTSKRIDRPTTTADPTAARSVNGAPVPAAPSNDRRPSD